MAQHDIGAKNTLALGRAGYHQQFEAMLYGWKAGAQHYWCGARDQGNVWHCDKPARNDLHPTMQPITFAGNATSVDGKRHRYRRLYSCRNQSLHRACLNPGVARQNLRSQ